ncbi:ATP-binding protein [Xanthomonas fragariae]|uniref:Sensory/regulatory protein RpfC n=1 Tax=Xanthomonas fragariae TaxID=48664 RepID=A0A1Y6HP92_9XANT|nr:ATP-binding protein [Xanthomonas fragariae]AOD16205.1 hybrid sensor histidine kinase/response regulator [Xanthomonas fragariae]AOD19636.1 hybrid sensor histidine kinase/response regulator [Xanthomonas fragariae]ENZ95463.1 two-component system sensor protein [Xanthomonas fragariae LMG 25863]MBL9197132.1 response regulator [Xanthomonas fragariae]MBL9222081.1 response regulator [Xanthomonas fragariae]
MTARAGGLRAWSTLATLAALVAALGAGLQWSALQGPWLAVTAVSATLAMVFGLCAAIAANRALRTQQALSQRLEEADLSRERLQQELQRHGELEQELLRAKQAAEAATLAKGEFLATMSHEIRTPLNGIVPMLELISSGQLSVDQREMLQTATGSSLQLLRIVDDILDYSKLEANKLELETTTFNLRELLDGVVQLLQRTAEGRQLRLSLDIEPSVRLLVRGDPIRLRQVLGNLIGNAIKFTERGSVDILLRRLGETRAQHLLRFQVRDTGIGIAPDQQARLFRSFAQADASTTRLYGGTGLGLAICKRIVDLMGGRIGVESEPGRGATFWFEIPLLKVIGDLQQNTGTDAARVMVISSDARLSQRLKRLLDSWGVSHVLMETTQEALERVRRHSDTEGFRCVIADHDKLRYSARAVHRALARPEDLRGSRLIWLYGEEPVPAELQDNATLVPRQSPDETLRALVLPPDPKPAHAAALDSEAIPDPLPPPMANPRDVRILLAEDNPVNLLVAQKLLAFLGFEADTATDGEAALSSMESTRYDMVFMDCQMPVLDGYAATRRWRAMETESGRGPVPIVAMTANAMAGDRERCLAAGMDDYLSKPVAREQLDACLQRWLPRQQALPELASCGPAAMNPESASAAAQPILDNSVIDELYEVAGADTFTILQLFLEDAPLIIERLEVAAANRDSIQLRDLAHTLTSSSANVGAQAVSNAARRIELAARTGTIERPSVMVALVVAEYARARLALLDKIARLQSATRAAS